MLLEGIEASVINFSDIDKIKGRLDSEYYRKEDLVLEKALYKIGSITLNKTNAVLDCSAFYPSITDHYNFDGQGIPFLRVNEIKGGLVKIDKKTAFLPQSILSANANTIAIAYPGDILIAKGGNTLAKVGIVPDSYKKFAISRDLIILRTDKLVGHGKYFLWLFLHSKYGQRVMWRTASQTGQPHLTLPSIAELPVPKCSTKFEEMIGVYYTKFLEFSDLHMHLYQEANNFLLKALDLSSYIPENRLFNIKLKSSSFLETGRLDAEYYQSKFEVLLAHIRHLNYLKLSEIVDIYKSIEPGSDAYLEEGIPFIRVADINEFGLNEPSIHLDNEIYRDVIRPTKNTILLTKDGSVGIGYYLTEDLNAITSGAILHLRMKNDAVLPQYLTLVLNSIVVKMQAERDAGGSIIQHWKPSEIEEVLIPILSNEQQRTICDLLEKSFKYKNLSINLLDCMKQAVEMVVEYNESVAIDFLKEATK
ncbi:restriction endonuclease subunit S [Acinetobacter pittii]|uniref:restriction endonuclease subunit S n=1 Tax=Acinetobacter pittii TaxID=48296 RepID=UPI001BC88854|nr:restriction endonuclease subunit S [Acinetobacter pittii]